MLTKDVIKQSHVKGLGGGGGAGKKKSPWILGGILACQMEEAR